MNYYQIRFKADPCEILFELLQEQSVTVKEVLQRVKYNFQHSRLTLLVQKRTIDQDEIVIPGTVYIIMRKKMNRRCQFKKGVIKQIV